MTGAPEGSPKVVLWFYGEAGNRTCDPWFTRHSAYPLHHGGFSIPPLVFAYSISDKGLTKLVQMMISDYPDVLYIYKTLHLE